MQGRGAEPSSPSTDGETLCLRGGFTRGELTKQPGGLFFKRGRFTRKSVPLLCSYLNLSADLIGTITKIKVFLQSESQLSDWLFLNIYFFFVIVNEAITGITAEKATEIKNIFFGRATVPKIN